MIRISNLNKSYNSSLRKSEVLHDVSFSLPQTGFVCILGPSGCGKTSLLNTIGGLDRFDSGTISCNGITASRYGTRAYEAERNHSFGYIFQNYYLLDERSVAYNVYLGLNSLQLSHREKVARVREALRAVGMERYIRRSVGELSGGQQQRVSIARAIARHPRIILADEPTGNLDEANTLSICTLLRQISRSSLVIMVTHEERIASFFADRILRIQDGRISTDTEGTQASTLAMQDTQTLYAGDYQPSTLEAEGIRLQLLREPDAPPVELTLLALRDRIVIKLGDSRSLACGTPSDPPVLAEGRRPVLSRADIDKPQSDMLHFSVADNPPACRPGQTLSFRMLFAQAVRFLGERGARRVICLVFLAALTLLSCFIVGDYLEVSNIDPEDFITADSHLVQVQIDRGGTTPDTVIGSHYLTAMYLDYLDEALPGYELIPMVTTRPTLSLKLFYQTGTASATLTGLSYIPLHHLQEDTLLFGVMPKDQDEIVVDRWVLDRLAAEDGIVQNCISDLDYFLGKELTFGGKNLKLTIVGICDSGEPSLYLSLSALASIGNAGTPVMSLSELQARFPGQYDNITLDEHQCLLVPANAGWYYINSVEKTYQVGQELSFEIVDKIENSEIRAAKLIVSDSSIRTILNNMAFEQFSIYCEDKEAALPILGGYSASRGDTLSVRVRDRVGEAIRERRLDASKRMDTRAIVTATVLLLCMVMLYLLRRAQLQQRIPLLAVYRLLGIPKRKMIAMFTLESLMCCAVSALPAALFAYAGAAVLQTVPNAPIVLLLPWSVTAALMGLVTLYHQLASLLPLLRLLRLPPAQLAAKYDF